MAGQLVGKISVVTGAASGIGLAICKRFAAEGSLLTMVDKNATGLQNASKSLKVSADTILTVTGDISQTGFAQTVIDSSLSRFGKRSSVLVNCAGIVAPSLMIDMTIERFHKVVDVNLNGTFMFTKAFLKQFDFDKEGNEAKPLDGNIVNVSSLAGKTGMHYNANYAASKGGVISLTKSVCVEMARYGVRCNAVLPTFVETPMTTEVGPELLKYQNELTKLNPLQRVGTVDEVANVCLFLASNQSSYVNGTCVEVSGGFLA